MGSLWQPVLQFMTSVKGNKSKFLNEVTYLGQVIPWGFIYKTNILFKDAL